MTKRQIEDDVKSGDVVEDGEGNQFVVVKREGRAQGSEAERKAQLQTMRRLLGGFRVIAILSVVGLGAKVLLSVSPQNSAWLPDPVSLLFYAIASYAISVMLGFLINLAGWMERVNKQIAKQINRVDKPTRPLE